MSSETIGWIYCVIGYLCIAYPMSIPMRLGKNPSNKKLTVAVLMIPIMLACFILGVMMLVMGAEAVKGNIKL